MLALRAESELDNVHIMGKHAPDFQRILVPVSGASGDAHAIKIVSKLIEPKHAEVTAVFVIEVAQSLPLDAELPDEIDRGERALQSAETVARNFCGTRTDFMTTDLLQARSAGAAIVDEASERHCDLIVMTASCHETHGKRQISATVSYVLKNAPCEVMLLSSPNLNGAGSL
jgi:nucleotide-binding universal stress UspA family protein